MTKPLFADTGRIDRVPCMSLWQPWASLLATPASPKVHETRPWKAPEHLIGQRIYIHASLRLVDPHDHTLVSAPLIKIWSEWMGRSCVWGEMPRGCFVGSAVLRDCTPTEKGGFYTSEDFWCGNWGPGRFAWLFRENVRFAKPIERRGRQRIWYEPASLFEGAS